LLLHIAPIGPSPCRVPGPDLARVQGVQPPLNRPGGKIEQITDEVPVDVVRMGSRLDERAIEVDLFDSDRPELPHEHLRALHQNQPPGGIPLELVTLWTLDEDRFPGSIP
jgi:hypothetical protein